MTHFIAKIDFTYGKAVYEGPLQNLITVLQGMTVAKEEGYGAQAKFFRRDDEDLPVQITLIKHSQIVEETHEEHMDRMQKEMEALDARRNELLNKNWEFDSKIKKLEKENAELKERLGITDEEA